MYRLMPVYKYRYALTSSDRTVDYLQCARRGIARDGVSDIYRVRGPAPISLRRRRYELPVAVAVRQVHGRSKMPEGRFRINWRAILRVDKSRAFQLANAYRSRALCVDALFLDFTVVVCVRACRAEVGGRWCAVTGRGTTHSCAAL